MILATNQHRVNRVATSHVNRVATIASSSRAVTSLIRTARLERNPRKNQVALSAGSKDSSAANPTRRPARAPILAAAPNRAAITSSVRADTAADAVAVAKAVAGTAVKTGGRAINNPDNKVASRLTAEERTAASRAARASMAVNAVGVVAAAAGVIAAKVAAAGVEMIAVRVPKASKVAVQFERSVNYTIASR